MISPTLFTIGMILIVNLGLELLKHYKPQVEGNTTLLRLLVVAVCALGALYMDWLPDQTVTLATWYPAFWPMLLGAQFSYSWLIKTLTGLMPVNPNP